MGIAAVLLMFRLVAAEPLVPTGNKDARIAWFGTLKSGLAEAERTNKPILLISAAPQCVGVPGIW